MNNRLGTPPNGKSSHNHKHNTAFNWNSKHFLLYQKTKGKFLETWIRVNGVTTENI